MSLRRLFTPFLLAGLLANPAFAREITHAMGVTEVPDHPQRIVVLTNEGTEALLALGVTPVGAVKSWLGNPWYDHISGQMTDVTVLGEESAVNLEVLVSLQPDLILGSSPGDDDIYDRLVRIAPTLLFYKGDEDTNPDHKALWEERFLGNALLLGREARELEAGVGDEPRIGEEQQGSGPAERGRRTPGPPGLPGKQHDAGHGASA